MKMSERYKSASVTPQSQVLGTFLPYKSQDCTERTQKHPLCVFVLQDHCYNSLYNDAHMSQYKFKLWVNPAG